MSNTAAAPSVLKPPLAAWPMKVMRPTDNPPNSTRVIRATPTASRSRVLRRSMASTMARIASTSEMIGMIHLALTIRLNRPENFETCFFDTTVKLNALCRDAP